MKYSSKEKYTQLIKQKSRNLGFDFCGISKAEKLEEEERRLEIWLSRGFHGKMAYMGNHFEKRLDPVKLVPGARSVVSLLYNYFPDEEQKNAAYKISRYAYGHDYHDVIKKKLKDLLNHIKEEVGTIQGRIFVDSAPVMERQWAAKSGLGWLGKNTLLINKQQGSYFFLAEMIIDLELNYDGPIKDFCGTCTSCLDACPTDAIIDPYILDASKCISYITIELKDEIPEEFSGKYEKWIFGCDICQEVCPWNRFSKPHKDPDLKKSPGVDKIMNEGWVEFTEEVFHQMFKHSPIKRAKYKGLRRNIDFITKKSR